MALNNSSKLVVERSSFANEKSNHQLVIDGHQLNHAVEVILPCCESIPESVLQSCPEADQYFLVKNLPVLELVKENFVNDILKAGVFTALSVDRWVDSHDVVALLPSGHLILSVDKDTYQELGLQGRPSLFTGRSPTHFVIDIDLFSPNHQSGHKQYERVIWSLKGRPNLDLSFIFTWEPHIEEHSSHMSRLWDKYSIERFPLTKNTNSSGCTAIPTINSMKSLNAEDISEIYNWIGALSCAPSRSSERPTGINVECVTTGCWTGLITTSRIRQMLTSIRSLVKSSNSIPWAALTVHGFDDSPVTWSRREHGFSSNGCNLYSFIVFPNDNYWLYRGIGSNDICP